MLSLMHLCLLLACDTAPYEITDIDKIVPQIASVPAHIGSTAAIGSGYNHYLTDVLEVEGFICEDEGRPPSAPAGWVR